MIKLKDETLLKTKCLIDGNWVGDETYDVLNPANGNLIAKVPFMGEKEAQECINAANFAQKPWAALTAKERSNILKKWNDLIIENIDDLALILTSEQGKPLNEAKGEITYAASFVEFFAEEAKRIYGQIIPSPKIDARILVLKQPLGVVAAITPWNFPAAMITRKVAPALAAGCTIVCKPSEETPLTAFALGELFLRAGGPKGVLNIINGDGPKIGKIWCASDVVRGLSFTGSTEVGKILMRQSADTVKKLALELGGNAAFIVFDDADLEAAAEGIMASKFRNTGQTCVCANRIFAQDTIHDKLVEILGKKIAALKVGIGTNEGINQGPLIDKNAFEKVCHHVEDAVSKGAQIIIGGKPHELGGTFYEPTLLINANEKMAFAKEETFGPICPVFKFTTEDEAIKLANNTPFGLSSYFYAKDLGRVFRVLEAIEAGIVSVNSGIASNELAPFGGIKQSGLGREGSSFGIDEYIELKYVYMGIPN